MANVFPIMHTGELNFTGGEIGVVDCGFKCISTGRNAEHSAAIGNKLPVDQFRAGMKDGGSGGLGIFDPMNSSPVRGASG